MKAIVWPNKCGWSICSRMHRVAVNDSLNQNEKERLNQTEQSRIVRTLLKLKAVNERGENMKERKKRKAERKTLPEL